MDQGDRPQQNWPREDKGKGKETCRVESPSIIPSSSPIDDVNSQPLASRVLSSATQVAGHFSNAAAMVESLKSSSSSKGESSTLRSPLGIAGIDRPRPAEEARGGSTFRLSQGEKQLEQQDSTFSAFLESSPGLQPEDPTTSEHPQRRSQPLPPGAMCRVEDGAEAVGLLNSDTEEWLREEPPVLLTAEERVALQRALFGHDDSHDDRPASTPGLSTWDGMLNFYPGFFENDHQAAERHFGTSDIESARETWMDQWQVVLSSYTDAVWGDLEPLVREAQEELGGMVSSVPSEPKALRRLQQILSQIRGF